MITLDELKAQNKAEEEAAQETPKDEAPQEEEIKEESHEEVTEETADDSEEKAPPDSEESAETEEWLKADDEPASLPDSEAAKIRRKYKAQVTEQKEENAALKARIEELEKGLGKQPSQQALAGKPDREKYENDDDYLEALADWKVKTATAEQQAAAAAAQQKAQSAAAQQEVAKSVDSHYARAHTLATKSNINPDVYKAADQRVRDAVEAKFPGAGDDIVDNLISVLGEGSEKVFYHLGVNTKRLGEFLDTFDRHQGLATTAFLGRLNAELAPPKKPVSQAPAPGAKVQSDGKRDASGEQLKATYQKAHKRGDGQAAFDAKRAAQSQGIDTKGW